MDGDGIRGDGISSRQGVPVIVSTLGSNCVERRPYDCSLPGLAGFDREKVATLSSESAPPPPTC